jgi:hypothetical protein
MISTDYLKECRFFLNLSFILLLVPIAISQMLILIAVTLLDFKYVCLCHVKILSFGYKKEKEIGRREGKGVFTLQGRD